MVRLAFDVVCLLVSVIMLIRLRPKLRPGAFAIGAAFIAALWAGNTVVSIWLDPEFMFDTAMGACVLALTVVSKFDWTEAVPAEYRRDGVEGAIRTSRILQSAFVVLLLGLAFSVEAIIRSTSP